MARRKTPKRPDLPPGELEKKMLRAHMGWPPPTKRRPHHGLPAEILGIGFGVKRRKGKIFRRASLRIYVRQKIASESDIDPKLFIPRSINGIPTDIIEVRTIVAHAAAGESLGTDSGNIGTLGCLVTDGKSRFLLSNNHVLANVNQGTPGDPVYMPSRGQVPNAPLVATLCKYPPITMDGSGNLFDAAIAQLEPDTVIDPTIANVGAVTLPAAAPGLVAVTKGGAASAQTTGVIDGVNEDIQVMYNGDPEQTAHLTGQMAILGDDDSFSADGDSGSLVLTTPGLRPIGLLIGGSLPQPGVSQQHSFASPIQLVLDHFRVKIVVSEDDD